MKKLQKTIKLAAAALLSGALLCGCAMEKDDFVPTGGGRYEAAEAGGFTDSDVSAREQGQSGVVTAAEWNDIANWSFWGNLMNNTEWIQHAESWLFYPNKFVYVLTCTSDEKPVAGCKAVLKKGGDIVWSAVSDNSGVAVLWDGIYDTKYNPSTEGYTVEVEGNALAEFEFTNLSSTEPAVNKYQIADLGKANAIDVAFIVDATGSMGDEIEFLKQDLVEIITFVGKQCTAEVRTGTVFYRDEGDEYVTKYSKFTNDIDKTVKYINKQSAGGGGDYPEAVHEALKEGIQSLDWGNNIRSRIAFLILDAPPHHTESVIAACQKAISDYAKMGIKVIPVSCSGIDKETEYLFRSFALATNGTYVFLTNDSGVGDDHIEATVGEHTVEKLRDLIARLIIAYAK